MNATLVYYTDNNPESLILEVCQKQLLYCMEYWKFPIISVSQKPIDFGYNIVMNLERSVLSMYKQILKGLEEAKTDVIFTIEHDLLYSPSHFSFKLPDNKNYWYDRNRWCVDADTGKAVFYHSDVPSLLCANRELLIDHFSRKVHFVSLYGHIVKYGFSPPKGLPKELRIGGHKTYFSAVPTIDIRHSRSFTRRRMNKSQFSSDRSCRGWTESDGVPDWCKTLGCFREVLQSIIEEEGFYDAQHTNSITQ